MRYLFVSLTIVVVWAAIIALAVVVPGQHGVALFACAQIMTAVLFYLGFYRK